MDKKDAMDEDRELGIVSDRLPIKVGSATVGNPRLSLCSVAQEQGKVKEGLFLLVASNMG